VISFLGFIRWRLVKYLALIIIKLFYKRMGGTAEDRLTKWIFSKINTEKFDFSTDEVLIQFDRSQVLMLASQKSILEREVVKNGYFYLVDFADPHISNNNVCLDIGANTGIFSVPLAKRRPFVEIYGLEPHPQLFDRYCTNIRSNRITNLKPLNIAASDNNNILTFFSQDLSKSDNWGLSSTVYAKSIGINNKISVKSTTCDQLKKDIFPNKKVDFVKIDVQGGELAVLKGMIEILYVDRPIVVFEHEDEFFENPGSIKLELKNLFDSVGYSVYVLSKRFQKMYFPVKWESEISVDLIAIPFKEVK
jgi:FkbM family methyltransferase